MNQRRKNATVPASRSLMRRPGAAAFTLIELSIVLIVIGLIVGGVLAGQSLIRQSQLRSIIKEEQQLETAVYAFKDKYACLPGDCANASSFFTGAHNGNGNGEIEPLTVGHPESVWMFDDLNRAGVTYPLSNPGDSTTLPAFLGVYTVSPGFNIPASNYPGLGYELFYIDASIVGLCVSGGGGGMGGYYAPGQCDKHVVVFSSALPSVNWWGGLVKAVSPVSPTAAMPCTDIQQLDVKFDDGMPFGGKIQVPGLSSFFACISPFGVGYPSAPYAPGAVQTTLTSPLIFVTGI